jgi:hypothetical protein
MVEKRLVPTIDATAIRTLVTYKLLTGDLQAAHGRCTPLARAR